MGMNRLYCCQFSTVILVPSGMLSIEAADASDAYAPGSKETSALGAGACSAMSARADIRVRRNLPMLELRFVMIPLLVRWTEQDAARPGFQFFKSGRTLSAMSL